MRAPENKVRRSQMAEIVVDKFPQEDRLKLSDLVIAISLLGKKSDEGISLRKLHRMEVKFGDGADAGNIAITFHRKAEGSLSLAFSKDEIDEYKGAAMLAPEPLQISEPEVPPPDRQPGDGIFPPSPLKE